MFIRPLNKRKKWRRMWLLLSFACC